jgi:hypothetical protein
LPNVELHGCDIAADSVRWCQDNLVNGQFVVSSHDPPLPYPGGHFGLIYATSVLTHLTFDEQYNWMRELWRLLRPSGVAVLTAHGPTMLPNLLAAAHGADRVTVTLIDEEPFVCLHAARGANETGNMQSRAVLELIFSPFRILDYRPRYGLMGIQDTYGLKKEHDGPLRYLEMLTDHRMSGTEFRARVPLSLDGATRLRALATVSDLVYPATIRVTVGTARSASAPLPMMLQWTGLTAAYASIAVDNILSTADAMEIVVSSARPLDGHALKISKALLF